MIRRIKHFLGLEKEPKAPSELTISKLLTTIQPLDISNIDAQKLDLDLKRITKNQATSSLDLQAQKLPGELFQTDHADKKKTTILHYFPVQTYDAEAKLEVHTQRRQHANTMRLDAPHSFWNHSERAAIPDNLHWFWVGCMLSKQHQQRLLEWQKLNPEFSFNLWSYPETLTETEYQELKDFCSLNNIQLRLLSELKTKETQPVFDFIDGLIARNKVSGYYLNPGAISDLARYLLLEEGGWYFDTDVPPRKIPQLRPHWGFYVALEYETQLAMQISPCVLAAVTNSTFIQVCINICTLLVSHPNNAALRLGLSDLQDQSYLSTTMSTTGAVYRFACMKLQAADKITFLADDSLTMHSYFNEQKFCLPAWLWSPEDLIDTREKSWYAEADSGLANSNLPAMQRDSQTARQHAQVANQIIEDILEQLVETPVVVKNSVDQKREFGLK